MTLWPCFGWGLKFKFGKQLWDWPWTCQQWFHKLVPELSQFQKELGISAQLSLDFSPKSVSHEQKMTRYILTKLSDDHSLLWTYLNVLVNMRWKSHINVTNGSLCHKCHQASQEYNRDEGKLQHCHLWNSLFFHSSTVALLNVAGLLNVVALLNVTAC